MDTLFRIANLSVLPGWLLLLVAPRFQLGRRLIAAVLIPGLLGGLYAYLMISNFGSAPDGGFGSLDGIAALFANPAILLAGWIHYLAFDLFVGAWEVRDSIEHGVPHWAVVPCLLLTFFAGPLGLALYFLCRGAFTKRWAVGIEGSAVAAGGDG